MMVVPGGQPEYGSSGVAFPKSFVNLTAFVAEHGSAAAPTRPGFRVAAVRVTNGNGTALSHVNFASGWLLPNGAPWGESRPSQHGPILWPNHQPLEGALNMTGVSHRLPPLLLLHGPVTILKEEQ
jgi:hypothetical protein